ncbi:hypothetical protein B0189_07500 [Moraxella cuniculi]|nr:hypothetical protein B0189_07500 [Moraxella cuniculi]
MAHADLFNYLKIKFNKNTKLSLGNQSSYYKRFMQFHQINSAIFIKAINIILLIILSAINLSHAQAKG